MSFVIKKSSDIIKEKLNTTIDSGGRFGNTFMRNIVSDKIAKTNDLSFTYDRLQEMNSLGISLYMDGQHHYEETLLLEDKIIDAVLFDEYTIRKFVKMRNILFKQHSYNPFNIYDHAWCQTPSIAKYIRMFVETQKENIMNANPYKERYKNNNSVIVHVRLGDIVDLKFYTKYEYYEKALSSISFEKGFITSDSIDHEICKKLIHKFNLEHLNLNVIQTIQFASTCSNIILSTGTYSFVIGLFAFFSKIYYPEVKVRWHGDIFVFKDWNKICY